MAALEQAAVRLRLLRLCPSTRAPREVPGVCAQGVPAASPSSAARSPCPSPAESLDLQCSAHASKRRRGAALGSRAALGSHACRAGASCRVWRTQATVDCSPDLQCSQGNASRVQHTGSHKRSPCFYTTSARHSGASARVPRAVPSSGAVSALGAPGEQSTRGSVGASRDSPLPVPQESCERIHDTREGQGQGTEHEQVPARGQGQAGQGQEESEDQLLRQLTALASPDYGGHTLGIPSSTNTDYSTETSGGTGPRSISARGGPSRERPQRKVEARKAGIKRGGADGLPEEEGAGEGKGRGLFTLCAVEKGELLVSVPTTNVSRNRNRDQARRKRESMHGPSQSRALRQALDKARMRGAAAQTACSFRHHRKLSSLRAPAYPLPSPIVLATLADHFRHQLPASRDQRRCPRVRVPLRPPLPLPHAPPQPPPPGLHGPPTRTDLATRAAPSQMDCTVVVR